MSGELLLNLKNGKQMLIFLSKAAVTRVSHDPLDLSIPYTAIMLEELQGGILLVPMIPAELNV